MVTSDELVKAFLNVHYPDYIYFSHDEYNESTMKNSFIITYRGTGGKLSSMEISMIEFITFVVNKLSKNI